MDNEELEIREMILSEIAEIVGGKFNQNLFFGAGGYNLRFLMNTLHYEPDPYNMTNKYWIETGSPEGNKIWEYFEYGTGLFNTKAEGMPITPLSKKAMKFATKKGNVIFTKKVKGVKARFMLTRTLKYAERNSDKILDTAMRRLNL